MNRNKAFFRTEKKQYEEIVKVPATQDYCDENGNPIEWEFKVLDSKTDSDILRSCIKNTDKGVFVDQIDYKLKYITASCVFPELNDVELQNEYGVTLPSHLLMQLVSNPFEFSTLYDRLILAIAARKEIKSKRKFEEYGE